jgi:Flp pilus assembly protein TadG
MRPSNLASFAQDRGGAAAVEFALNIMVLLLFMFGIINLGDLGLTIGTMERAVQSAVREAAIQTSNAIAQTGNPADCTTAAQLVADFNAIADPILPPATITATQGDPTISYSWSNATAANPVPGTVLSVTAAYHWVPLGLSQSFGPGVPLSISSTQLVIGTSGATTSCT